MIFEENDEDEIEMESEKNDPSEKKTGSMLLSEDEDIHSKVDKTNSKFVIRFSLFFMLKIVKI